jgi:hypothetical protein
MTENATTDHIISQGSALVRAVEALDEIKPSGWFERMLARLLLAAYKRRLHGILDAVPGWVRAKILNTSLGNKSLRVDKN